MSYRKKSYLQLKRNGIVFQAWNYYQIKTLPSKIQLNSNSRFFLLRCDLWGWFYAPFSMYKAPCGNLPGPLKIQMPNTAVKAGVRRPRSVTLGWYLCHAEVFRFYRVALNRPIISLVSCCLWNVPGEPALPSLEQISSISTPPAVNIHPLPFLESWGRWCTLSAVQGENIIKSHGFSSSSRLLVIFFFFFIKVGTVEISGSQSPLVRQLLLLLCKY